MVQIVRVNIWYDVIFLLCMEYCDYNWDHIQYIQVPLIYPSAPFFYFFEKICLSGGSIKYARAEGVSAGDSE
jgi:hypothetical protein